MNNVSNKQLAIAAISLYATLGFFLLSTNPQKLPAMFLLLPVLWLFVAIMATALLILRLINPGMANGHGGQQLLYASIVSGVPSGMLLLNSIDQLTIKDVLLIGLLAVIVLFYTGRFRFGRKVE
jgi:hypothetical protein